MCKARHFFTAMLLAVLMLPLSAAGEIGFKITDYKPDVFRDKQLYVTGSFSHQDQDQKYDYTIVPYDTYSLYQYEYKPTNSSGSLAAYYAYTYQDLQKYLMFSVTGNASYGRQKSATNSVSEYPNSYLGNSKNESEYEWYFYSIYPNFGARKYIKGDFSLYFSASGAYNMYDYQKYQNGSEYSYLYYPDAQGYVTDNYSKSESRQPYDSRSYNIYLSAGPNWGRTYTGRFAATAIYIIEELQKNNLLKAEPTQEQMLHLCELVYKNKLLHAIDSRIRLIESMQEILDYLAGEGIVKNDQSMTYLLTSDVWSYFSSVGRDFGFMLRLAGGVELEGYGQDTKYLYTSRTLYEHYHVDTADVIDTTYNYSSSQKYEIDRKRTSTLPYLLFSASYSKPLNMKWHYYLSLNLQYYIGGKANQEAEYIYVDPSDTTKLGETEFEFENFYMASTGATFYYIPNTRTTVMMYGTLGYGGFDRTDTETEKTGGDERERVVRKFSYDDMVLLLRLTATYRITIPTYVNLSIEYTNGYQPRNVFISYNDFEYEALYLSGSVTHYLF
ncbi:MAG: hypothetical protein AB1690_03585 [Candidatus Zixiibacteriota bacterium]